MPKDYANKQSPPPQSSRVPGWVWVFTSLAAAAFVGFLYYLSTIPAEDDGAQAVREHLKQSLPAKEKQAPQQTAPETPNGENQPETKPVQPSLEQAFEFYKLLKEDEVPITLPEPDLTREEPGLPREEPGLAREEPVESSPAPAELSPEGERWMIQVASFSQVSDADRLRAQLIINGLTEAHLTTVELADRGTYHRVMVGPLDERSRLDQARNILAGLNHEVLVRTLN